MGRRLEELRAGTHRDRNAGIEEGAPTAIVLPVTAQQESPDQKQATLEM
jgi:hypothetical protein